MSILSRITKIWRDHRFTLGIPFRGWRYYVDCDWWCSYPQGGKPWVREVHPKCADIKGWRFGWRRLSVCWGRDRIYK